MRDQLHSRVNFRDMYYSFVLILFLLLSQYLRSRIIINAILFSHKTTIRLKNKKRWNWLRVFFFFLFVYLEQSKLNFSIEFLFSKANGELKSYLTFNILFVFFFFFWGNNILLVLIVDILLFKDVINAINK